MKSLRIAHPPVRLVAVLLALVMVGIAAAQEGPAIGVGGYPFAGVASLHASLPLWEVNDVRHAARADVAYAFEGIPGVSASYLLRDAAGGFLSSYLGAGIGLAFPEAPASSPALGAHALVGASVPLTGRFGVFAETVVAGNAFGTRLDLGVGVTYRFGGSD